MGRLIALLLLQVYTTTCMDQLDIKFEWKQLDYQYPSVEARQEALDSKEFIPENNMPMGLEIYEDRLFVTVPRWRAGVPSSLNYISLKGNSTSPKLIPYPSWAAHAGKVPEIVSPFRVRADKCGRLWVMDSGVIGSRENVTTKYPPAIIVYDLKTDNLLRKFTIPAEQLKNETTFVNIAIEDTDCQKPYAYAIDVVQALIVVYSWEKNESWRISHEFFRPDPQAIEYNVNGVNFTWSDAIVSIGVDSPNADNFTTLYFHPLSSYKEFSVSTMYLRNQSIADAHDAFKLLGSRGPNAQSSVSFLDPKTKVLFYALVNLNAVACWRTTNTDYNMKNQGRIYMNNQSMIYPSDIKVDYDDKLWIISNRLPIWMYSTLNPEDVNFRIFSAPVLEAISHTACDVKPRSDILDKFINKVNNVSTTETSSTSATEKNSANGFAPVCFITMFMCWFLLVSK